MTTIIFHHVSHCVWNQNNLLNYTWHFQASRMMQIHTMMSFINPFGQQISKLKWSIDHFSILFTNGIKTQRPKTFQIKWTEYSSYWQCKFYCSTRVSLDISWTIGDTWKKLNKSTHPCFTITSNAIIRKNIALYLPEDLCWFMIPKEFMNFRYKDWNCFDVCTSNKSLLYCLKYNW